MGNVWKEHKKFIMAVGAGGLVFLIWYSWFIGGLEAEAASIRQNRMLEENNLNSLLAAGMPEESTVQRAKTDVQRAKETLGSLVEDLAFQASPSYTPSPGDTKKKHFDDKRIDVYRKLQEKSVQNSLTFPSTFGFESVPDEYGEELAGELLTRLAVTEFVWKKIIDGIGPEGGKIMSIDPLHDNADPGDGPIAVEGLFLNSVSVHFKFTANSECVFSVLHGIQQRGTYLSVVQFSTKRTNVSRDVMEVELVVSALRINPDGALQPPDESDEWD